MNMHQSYRNNDPSTSIVAASTLNTSDLENLVVEAIKNNAPGTTEEIAAWTELSIVTVSPRMRPLERKGIVRRIGKRQNASGRPATIWGLV
jgi:predicted ArsR family transcriptional regulator